MNQPPDRQKQVEDWVARQATQDTTIALSVVVPAYNEERRLPPTLIDMVDYFDGQGIKYEIIVVDDGSRDQTVSVVAKFEKLRSQIRLIRLPQNYGKGHAVRTGVLNAKGRRIVFADADGATPIEEIERLNAAVDAGADCAIGSRAKASEETKVVTRWYRKYLGRMFNAVVNFVILPDVADTQCGFKMFTAPAGRFLFEHQRANGFSFDVEILFLARQVELQVAEVPINWHNVPGSKVNLVLDALRMFRDVFRFRVRHRGVKRGAFEKYLSS